MGSSRDWAAKGTNLLGVKIVIAQSYERIHRSNLVMMGVLPLEFKKVESADSLGLEWYRRNFLLILMKMFNHMTTSKLLLRSKMVIW